MSENKPNDEPKLSTTDRVVKCKCYFPRHTETTRYHSSPSEQQEQTWRIHCRSSKATAAAAAAAVAEANVVEMCLLAMEEEGC